MKYPKNIWEQLKNKCPADFISALDKDTRWKLIKVKGAEQIWKNRNNGNRVSIHLHKTGYRTPGLIKSLLADIGWTIEDMKRLKLI